MVKKYGKDKAVGGKAGLTQLKQDLKTASFGRLYLFFGEERYLLDYYLESLKKKIMDGPAQDFNYHRFTQENMDLDVFAQAVEAMPMLAEHTLIQVDDYDLTKLSETSRDSLTTVLSDIPDYCTVVFVFDTVPYKIDGRYKKLKEAFAQGLEVEFARQAPKELNSWIRKHFKAYDKDISDPLCEYLTFLTGGSMSVLGSEIEKVASYASGREITKQDLDAVVIPVLDAEIFDLTDALTAYDYERALQKLRTLLQMQQEPILLLGAMGSQLRRLLYARACMEAGKGESALGEMLKAATGRAPHPYVLQKTFTAARRVSDLFCARAVTLCLETDAKLKGFSGDDQRTLELLLLALAQETGHG